jgi:hypothetical protein
VAASNQRRLAACVQKVGFIYMLNGDNGATTRIAYIFRASEAEVAQRAYECMADEEACRVEIW